jgi:Fe-S-cluster containining protein
MSEYAITKLTELHADIDARVQAIRESQPEWLCRRGCAACCHRLAEIPQLTRAEWNLLQKGLETLPADERRAISAQVLALAGNPARPIVCPMLDETAGACRVYPFRPVACRTYGFFVERDLGLYCKDIEAQVDRGELSMVIWGNQDRVTRVLNEFEDTRDLTEWFQSWKDAPDQRIS